MADTWAQIEEKYAGLYPPEFWDWLVKAYPEGYPGTGLARITVGTNLDRWYNFYQANQPKAALTSPEGITSGMYLKLLEGRLSGSAPDKVKAIKTYAEDLINRGEELGQAYPLWEDISKDYSSRIKRLTPVSEEMTPYQKEQVRLTQEGREQDRIQALRDMGFKQQELDFRRFQAQQETIQANREAQWKMQPRETYEQYRDRLMSELNQPQDWITKWQVGNAGRMGQPSSLQTYAEEKGNKVRELQTAFAQRQASLAEAEKAGDLQRAASILGDVQQISGELSKALTDYQTNPFVAEQQAIAQQQMERNALGDEGGSYVPKAPPAPKWLPVFAPGQKAGQEITKEQIRTPDVGLWSRTPTSVKAGLQGYMGWTGQDYQDTLDQMRATLPQQVTRQGQWRPVRQRGY